MKELTFTQEDGFYVAEVETNGEPIAVQVNRKYFPYPHDYSLEVLGRIDPSMPWAPVQMFDYKSPRNIIVYQNIPVDGYQLKLRSRTEVESAGCLGAEPTAQIVIPTEEQIGFQNPGFYGEYIGLIAICDKLVSEDQTEIYIDGSSTEKECDVMEITSELADELPFLADYVGQYAYSLVTYTELTGMHILKLKLGYSESLDLPIVLPSFAPVPIIRVTKQPETPNTATIEIEAEGADGLEYSYDGYDWFPYTGPIEDTTLGPRTIIAVSYKEGYRENYASESYTLTPEPLSFTSKQDGSTIWMTSSMINMPNLEYSRDGINWTAWTFSDHKTDSLTLDGGEKLYIRGTNSRLATSGGNFSRFVMTGEIAASGDIRALLITGAPIANYCFFKLFSGCTALTAAPELPATTLARYCYSEMFSGCTALTAAPELPATTLDQHCYSKMFYGCTALTSAPELPATTLDQYCYSEMFSGCTALTSAPELPATTLDQYCYSEMFSGCTALTSAPELPATTIIYGAYAGMFRDCTSLTTAPELPATMLYNNCYSEMFSGCTALNSVTVGASGWNENNAIAWLSGVAATGTFTKPAGTDIPTGASGIPNGWTVVNV